MTDRVPGAPGQYKATITTAELQKLQNGEEFNIILKRDDQPTTEGTPYNKASVLPDELAAVICPDVEDPKPADAFAGLLPKTGGEMAGNINMNGNKVTGLGTPADDGDAVNLSYIKETIGSLKAKTYLTSKSGTVKTTVNINAGGYGKTILVLYSGHENVGFETSSEIGIVQCGYDGNNFAYHMIKKAWNGGVETGATLFTLSTDDSGNLIFNNGSQYVARITFIGINI